MPLSFSENEREDHINKQQLSSQEISEGPNGYTKELKELYCHVRDGSLKSKKSNDIKFSIAEDEKFDSDVEDKKPKHVIISEEVEEEANVESVALRRSSGNSDSLLENSVVSDGYLTLSGTVKRGKKKVQNVEVILNMSREELEILEANLTREKRSFKCRDGSKNGIHILFWSLICLPFCFLISTVYSFYIGTITWYNIFTLFSERRSLGYQIFLPPFLILTYPFFIVLCSVGLGIFASICQISWRWDSWRKEFGDFEKGFFAWLCNLLDLSECSPYEVIVLSGIGRS